MSKKKTVGAIVYHVLVAIGAFIMVYPLLWMILSSFKPTNTILATSRHLIPKTQRILIPTMMIPSMKKTLKKLPMIPLRNLLLPSQKSSSTTRSDKKSFPKLLEVK